MNEKHEDFNNYLKKLLETYGHTKEQWNDYVKRTHTSEIQSKRGSKNTSEQQSLKGRNNTSEQQRIKALKSAQVRFEGSNEQRKPWLILGISRRTYYYNKKKD